MDVRAHLFVSEPLPFLGGACPWWDLSFPMRVCAWLWYVASKRKAARSPSPDDDSGGFLSGPDEVLAIPEAAPVPVAEDEKLAEVVVVVCVVDRVVLGAHDRLRVAVECIVDVRSPDSSEEQHGDVGQVMAGYDEESRHVRRGLGGRDAVSHKASRSLSARVR